MAVVSAIGLVIQGSLRKPSINIPNGAASDHHHPKVTSPSLKPPSSKPLWKKFGQVPPLQGFIVKTIESSSRRMFDCFVDSVFRFVDHPSFHSQRNFAPVEEIGDAAQISCTEGQIPHDFPEGVFVRNGPNPLFGVLKSTESIFGRSSQTWVEGEGMLHAVYFNKTTPSSSSSGGSADSSSNWMLSYKNRYIETETLKLEMQRQKPAFLPALDGDSSAILAAYFLNLVRFGQENKHLTNTNVFEHSGKLYAIAENTVPHEVDIHTLETKGIWDIMAAWNHPTFTSHPKRAPHSGELVVTGINLKRPYLVAGVISDDKLVHKADLEIDRAMLSHEVGVTERYNVIWDHPVVLDFKRLVSGGPLLKYEKQGYARIGVMPRYGDASSVQWFSVDTNCTFHLFNCYEDGNEVIVRGCKALASIIPGPDWGVNKFDWFSRGFNFSNILDPNDNNVSTDEEAGYLFIRAYEWRLNMETGQVKETNLSTKTFSMDFPFINPNFTGLKNKFGYAQVIHSKASSQSGADKYGAIAKLHFDEPLSEPHQGDVESKAGFVKIEYHHFEENTFCSGSVFIPKVSGTAVGDEDSGWIVTYVHNEETEKSQVYIIDSKKFGDAPIAKIDLPQRVPYGFHGTFVPTVYK